MDAQATIWRCKLCTRMESDEPIGVPRHDSLMSVMKKLAIVLLLFFSAPLVVAQDNGESVKQAIEKVKKETGGQVLSTTVKTIGGQRVVRVKVLDKNGVVRYVNVEAKP